MHYDRKKSSKAKRKTCRIDGIGITNDRLTSRGGKKYSNHGDTAAKMILHMVARIRTGYRGDVPIVLLMDSGFFDQKLFDLCERLRIGFVCGGRLSEDVKN